MSQKVIVVDEQLSQEIAIMDTCIEAVQCNDAIEDTISDGLCFQWYKLKEKLLKPGGTTEGTD